MALRSLYACTTRQIGRKIKSLRLDSNDFSSATIVFRHTWQDLDKVTHSVRNIHSTTPPSPDSLASNRSYRVNSVDLATQPCVLCSSENTSNTQRIYSFSDMLSQSHVDSLPVLSVFPVSIPPGVSLQSAGLVSKELQAATVER